MHKIISNNHYLIHEHNSRSERLGGNIGEVDRVTRGKWILQVGWLRASDQTILSVHTRTVTHNARISVSYESSGCSGAGAAGGSVFGVTGSSQAAEEVVNGTWRLHIRQLKESDRDCYMCQINTSPMISELGCLDILGELRMLRFLFSFDSIDRLIPRIY